MERLCLTRLKWNDSGSLSYRLGQLEKGKSRAFQSDIRLFIGHMSKHVQESLKMNR